MVGADSGEENPEAGLFSLSHLVASCLHASCLQCVCQLSRTGDSATSLSSVLSQPPCTWKILISKNGRRREVVKKYSDRGRQAELIGPRTPNEELS